MPSDPAAIRRSVYTLFTVAVLAVLAGRVVGVEHVFEPSRYVPEKEGSWGYDRPDTIKPPPTRTWPKARPEPMPTFSSNDRSRWASVRALVDEGTYVVGKRIPDATNAKGYRDTGIVWEDEGYRTLDIVMNPDTGEFFSSKPPLFSTLVAGEYWLLKKLFGWSLATHRWHVVCFVVITVNVLPFGIYLLLLGRLLEQYGTTDWGRLFVFAAACLGTFLNPFAVTLNNHNPAAYCTLFAIYPLLRNREYSAGSLLASGFFAGMAVSFDLPALSFLVGLFLPLLVMTPARAIAFFLLASLLPLALQANLNYVALGTWEPAYAKFGGPWYEYEGSHWARLKWPKRPPGIDFANEEKHIYLFHMLLGHHGLFSLTPVWILSIVGTLWLGVRALPAVRGLLFLGPRTRSWDLPLVGGLTLAIVVTAIAYYTYKSNNYGGFTNGLRWLFWVTPLLLLSALPVADKLAGSRLGRGLGMLCLAVSAFSAAYTVWNPWRMPWLYHLGELQGWFSY
jgi:hypothetical protein